MRPNAKIRSYAELVQVFDLAIRLGLGALQRRLAVLACLNALLFGQLHGQKTIQNNSRIRISVKSMQKN